VSAYSFLTDVLRQVTNILQPAHGGTGHLYGSSVLIVEGQNDTGADLPVGTLVQWTGFRRKVKAVTALDSTHVLGVVRGYFDTTSGLVEADAADGARVAVQTVGVCEVLIESAVTADEYAFAAATDGTAYSSATLATGAWGRFLGSADTGNGDTTGLVYLMATGAGGGGGSTTFGTPALTFSTSNAAGSGTSAIRTTATIALFDATVPVTQAPGDAAATGSAAVAARRDHVHGMPAALTGGFDIVVNTPAVGDVCDIDLPFAGTWTDWRVFNDGAGSIQYDLWVDAYASFPPTVGDTKVGSNKPKTTSATNAKDAGGLTGWTTSFSAGDVLRVHIDSTSGGVGRSVLSLRYTRS